MAHDSGFGEDQTRLALEDEEENGVLRPEAVRDGGLNSHIINGQDLLTCSSASLCMHEEQAEEACRQPGQ